MLQSEHATSACNSPLQHLHSPDQFKSPGLYGAFLPFGFCFFPLFGFALFFLFFNFLLVTSCTSKTPRLFFSCSFKRVVLQDTKNACPEMHCMLGFISCIHLVMFISPFKGSLSLRVVEPFFVVSARRYIRMHAQNASMPKWMTQSLSLPLAYILMQDGAWYAVFKNLDLSRLGHICLQLSNKDVLSSSIILINRHFLFRISTRCHFI